MAKKQKGIMVCSSDKYLYNTIKGLRKLDQNLFFAAYSTDNSHDSGDNLVLDGYKISLVNFDLLCEDVKKGNLPYNRFKEDVSCFVAIVDKQMLVEKVNFFLGINVPLIICCTKKIPKKIVNRLKKAEVPILVYKDVFTPEQMKECIGFLNKKNKGYFLAEKISGHVIISSFKK